MDVFEIGRNNYLFCGALGREAACAVSIGVLGYEATTFSVIVYGIDEAEYAAMGAASKKVRSCNGHVTVT